MEGIKVPGATDPLAGFLACLRENGRLLAGDGRLAVECPDKTWAELDPRLLDEAEEARLVDLSGESVRLTRRGRELAAAWAQKWYKPRRKGRVV